ncbi:MAG: UDP-N-acetylmuramoyl-tripeptide--D-alanyl-D-alanine ligase [Proteobacteria bacterium]|nr:UDP-N-acetylmuramoyl-tripeptide--D-alanyl-D-alanine ligase [Pseudomonadota bacterium]
MSGSEVGRFHPPAKLSVDEIIAATGGTFLAGPRTGTWSICTDSRAMADGAIFVALTGEIHDGHTYAKDVVQNHQGGALISTKPDFVPKPGGGLRLPHWVQGPIISVPDTLIALGQIARFHLMKTQPAVAAVTGSVGKTTTRTMLATILEALGPGLSTEGNFNNRIGVPLTLLSLKPEHRWVVLEMGMSEPGEIRALANIARPRVRVITTVSKGHLEFFDSVNGIAEAKGELFEEARPGDICVSPRGWFMEFLPQPPGAIRVTFGWPGAGVNAVDIEHAGLEGTRATLQLDGEAQPVTIPVLGRHQIHNAMAAAAAALHMGCNGTQIAEGLARVELPGRRMRVEEIRGITVIDDAYNANPASVKAALETIQDVGRAGRLVVALGDMLELGEEAPRLHEEAGAQAVASGANLFVGTGPLMGYAVKQALELGLESVAVFDSEEAGRILRRRLKQGDVLLVKGSRSMRMESVLDALRKGR